MRALHLAAEAAPWVKTGGLADVIGALPAAQRDAGADARLLVPGYPAIVRALADATPVAGPFVAPVGQAPCRLLRGTYGDVPVYVLDCPWLYRRDGNPYIDASGAPWHDSHLRFGLLGWAGAQLAAGALDPHWTPDLLHAHDWHAALACWLLERRPGPRPATAFSVHNIGYQGLFPAWTLEDLPLSRRDWHPGGLEFHGELSFMKAGLVSSDGIGTVSPTHAREIVDPSTGHGLHGVLRSRGDAPVGILNGIDTRAWDPARDPALVSAFDASDLDRRLPNRRALRAEMGLDADGARMLLGMVSRITSQKGSDLLISVIPHLVEAGCDLVVLGSGEQALEAQLRQVAARHPAHVAVHIGFDEALSHRFFAGLDALVVPSRYEPCGLTQLYAMRYGALPIVHRTGGLADSVDPEVGFLFERPDAPAFGAAIDAARTVFAQPQRWREMMLAAMRRDHGWQRAASGYLDWYRQLMACAPR
ncbi:MAG: glycogen synthase GlgA [Lautropia sp.]